MRKYIHLNFIAILINLLSSLASAQSANLPEATQTRRVKGQILTSTALPPLRIQFDKAFKYAGSQSFILYDRARVEQYFFTDTDELQHIRRMYMLQFEGYLPNFDATYDYPPTKTVDLGGQTYVVNTESIPNVAVALKQNPQSDVTRAAEFLENKGYVISESIVYERFVRLVDEAKRNEFILLYVEDAGTGASSEKAMQGFANRALKGFTILK